MPATFQIIALSSRDPEGSDTLGEPKLLYPDALKTVQELKAQGKAFRVFADSDSSKEQRQSFVDLGAVKCSR
jgi:hypothetical protein